MDLASALLGPFLRAARHWPWVLFLILLSLLCSLLGPGLQVAFHLPDKLEANLILRLATLLPLECYATPRFLARLDAELLNAEPNPVATWRTHFEARWLAACGAKLLLMAGLGMGLIAFVLPGLLWLFVFGWTPLRVLLRGERIREAALQSATMVAQNRLGMLTVGAFLGLMYAGAMLLLGLLVVLQVPQPTPWDRFVRPVFWGAYVGSGLIELSLSLSLLGLFHHLEARTTFIARNTPEAP